MDIRNFIRKRNLLSFFCILFQSVDYQKPSSAPLVCFTEACLVKTRLNLTGEPCRWFNILVHCVFYYSRTDRTDILEYSGIWVAIGDRILDGKPDEGRVTTWNWEHSVTPNVSSQVCHFYLAPLDSNNFTFVLKSVNPFAKVNIYIFYFSKLQTLYGQLRLQHDQ